MYTWQCLKLLLIAMLTAGYNPLHDVSWCRQLIYRLWANICNLFVTEKYIPASVLEPRVSCLAHEHSTTELSKPTQFYYSNLGFFLITLASNDVCVGGGVDPLRRSRVAGARVWHMYVGCYTFIYVCVNSFDATSTIVCSRFYYQ